MVQCKLAQVHRTALRRDRPENIGQIFKPELGGVFESLKLGIDLDVVLLALDFGFACRPRHLLRRLEWDLHCAHLAVVHRLCGMNDLAVPGTWTSRRLSLCRREHAGGNNECSCNQRLLHGYLPVSWNVQAQLYVESAGKGEMR